MAAICVNQALQGQECPLSERVVTQSSPISQKMTRFDLLENLTSLMAGIADDKESKPCSLEDSTIIPTIDFTITPSFLMDVAKIETFQRLIRAARLEAKEDASNGAGDGLGMDACDRFAVEVGALLLRFPNSCRVSIEIDPELSFDAETSFEKARKIVSLFEAHHVKRERVLVKLVSTWESIQASKKLEKEGINCNLTSLLKGGLMPQNMCHSWAWPEECLDTDSAFEHLPGDGKELRDFVNLTLFEG